MASISRWSTGSVSTCWRNPFEKWSSPTMGRRFVCVLSIIPRIHIRAIVSIRPFEVTSFWNDFRSSEMWSNDTFDVCTSTAFPTRNVYSPWHRLHQNRNDQAMSTRWERQFYTFWNIMNSCHNGLIRRQRRLSMSISIRSGKRTIRTLSKISSLTNKIFSHYSRLETEHVDSIIGFQSTTLDFTIGDCQTSTIIDTILSHQRWYVRIHRWSETGSAMSWPGTKISFCFRFS